MEAGSRVRVLLEMMRARCEHLFGSDNGTARRFELSTSCRNPRHWVKGEALVRLVLRLPAVVSELIPVDQAVLRQTIQGRIR